METTIGMAISPQRRLDLSTHISDDRFIIH